MDHAEATEGLGAQEIFKNHLKLGTPGGIGTLAAGYALCIQALSLYHSSLTSSSKDIFSINEIACVFLKEVYWGRRMGDKNNTWAVGKQPP